MRMRTAPAVAQIGRSQSLLTLAIQNRLVSQYYYVYIKVSVCNMTSPRFLRRDSRQQQSPDERRHQTLLWR